MLMTFEMFAEVPSQMHIFYREAFNALSRTHQPLLAPEVDPSLVRLFSGYGSGVGESGCMCGALTGSIVALNMVKGRATNQLPGMKPMN